MVSFVSSSAHPVFVETLAHILGKQCSVPYCEIRRTQLLYSPLMFDQNVVTIGVYRIAEKLCPISVEE